MAKKIKLPRNFKPERIVPYTPAEVAKMIAPCGEVGHASYERLRAHAMVLLLRYTGLRISDVALLGREPVTDGQIPLHTHKTGAHANRFRHTLATELLARGGSEQDVADILGISPTIVRKHYATWSQGRQERISTLRRYILTHIWHTKKRRR